MSLKSQRFNKIKQEILAKDNILKIEKIDEYLPSYKSPSIFEYDCVVIFDDSLPMDRTVEELFQANGLEYESIVNIRKKPTEAKKIVFISLS